MKRGLALEGGGARGAYQAGAIKALNRKKIYFDIAAGTSIGSMNAAFYVAKKCQEMEKVWSKINTKDILGIEGQVLADIHNKKFNFAEIRKEFDTIKEIIKNAGVDTKHLRRLLEKYINEEKFMKSNIDYGLVTFSISDMKPVEVYKNEMVKGKLIDYIIASSHLPGFKFERIIDDKYYLDGGVHLNCPIDMLLDRGCDEIYAIRLWTGKLKYNQIKGTKVHIIKPSEDLGSILAVTPELSEYKMKLGYYDTLKYIDKLDGTKYYFKKYDKKYYDSLFDKPTYKRMLKKYNKNKEPKSSKEFILRTIEKVCNEMGIERFKIYNTPFLLTKLKYKMVEHKNNNYCDFIKSIKVSFE